MSSTTPWDRGVAHFIAREVIWGKISLLPPTVSSSFMQWSSVCLDVPWSPEGFTSGRCTLSLRDDFFGSSILWGRIIFLKGSFCLLLYIQSWFLNAADSFVWSGTGPERGKSCPSGRTHLSVPHLTPTLGCPVPRAWIEPLQLFPLEALPPSAGHWNFIFPPWILSHNCNRLVELVE